MNALFQSWFDWLVAIADLVTGVLFLLTPRSWLRSWGLA